MLFYLKDTCAPRFDYSDGLLRSSVSLASQMPPEILAGPASGSKVGA